MTGQRRPPTNPNAITIYHVPPSDYDVIGHVRAVSEAGWTYGQAYQYAFDEMKKQAASVGANGILMKDVRISNQGFVAAPVGRSFVMAPIDVPTTEGLAIFVRRP